MLTPYRTEERLQDNRETSEKLMTEARQRVSATKRLISESHKSIEASKTARRASKARTANNVERIPASNPLAHDEGPRLIPLRVAKPAGPFQSHLDLADIALGRKR